MGGCVREGGCLILHPLGLLKDTRLSYCRDNPVSTAHPAGVLYARGDVCVDQVLLGAVDTGQKERRSRLEAPQRV